MTFKFTAFKFTHLLVSRLSNGAKLDEGAGEEQCQLPCLAYLAQNVGSVEKWVRERRKGIPS